MKNKDLIYNTLLELQSDDGIDTSTLSNLTNISRANVSHELNCLCKEGKIELRATIDGVLKVMRSYQYFAAWKISDRVSKNDWNSLDSHGGYIWHTTGSGKTLTSFKSAELIANSKDADKVVFLLDRVELGDQSLS